VTKILLLALLLAVLPPTLAAQTPEYQPSTRWPGVVETQGGFELRPTTELLAVLVSSSWCGGNAVKGFDAAIRQMKNALAARADSLGYTFSAIGVAVDWDVSTGIRYLMEGESTAGRLSFGPWAEIVVGRNYIDSASSLYVLPHGIRLTVPQVLIVQRLVTPTETRPQVGTPHMLLRVSGGEDIVEWARTGWSIPNLKPRPK
jgi:hypothetical protein